MDEFDPRTVFSSIDRQGRYAFANQPAIAQWNLARLAETLLPLIDADSERAVERALGVIEAFIDRFDQYYLEGLRQKIGLSTAEDRDRALVRNFLDLMRDASADHTLAFRELADVAESTEGNAAFTARLGSDAARPAEWLAAWRDRLQRDPQTAAERAAAMRRVNPAFIPRNHRVEAALAAATQEDDFGPFETLLGILQRPYDDQPAQAAWAQPPRSTERVLQTFCGT
jgi:uncharacterized protein YdiU (UPF0061 family)